MSRQLREWRLFWVKQFVARTQCTASSAHLLIDRIFVVRYILAHKVFRRTRGHFQKRFSDLTRGCWSGQADRAGEQLSGIFHDMWFDWRIDLFEPDTDLERALGMHELVARLLAPMVALAVADPADVGIQSRLQSLTRQPQPHQAERPDLALERPRAARPDRLALLPRLQQPQLCQCSV